MAGSNGCKVVWRACLLLVHAGKVKLTELLRRSESVAVRYDSNTDMHMTAASELLLFLRTTAARYCKDVEKVPRMPIVSEKN